MSLTPAERDMLRKLAGSACKNKQGIEALIELVENIFTSTIEVGARQEIGPGNVGLIPPGLKSFTIKNIGMSNAIVDGVNFYPGDSESYDASFKSVMSGMTYDTQLTTLLIQTIV